MHGDDVMTKGDKTGLQRVEVGIQGEDDISVDVLA